MQCRSSKRYFESKTKSIIMLSSLFATVFFMCGCTIIKMGSLFLSGNFEQQNFKSKVDCTFQRGLLFIPV